MGLTAKRIGPNVRRGARPRSDVSTHCAGIKSPLQDLVCKWSYPGVSRNADCCRQITGIASDRHRRSCGRGIASDKRAVRAWSGLIGPADCNDADIRVHAGGPRNRGRLRA